MGKPKRPGIGRPPSVKPGEEGRSGSIWLKPATEQRLVTIAEALGEYRTIRATGERIPNLTKAVEYAAEHVALPKAQQRARSSGDERDPAE